MNHIIKAFLVFCIPFVLFSCGGSGSGASSSSGDTFSGNISDAANLTVLFEKYNMSKASHIIGSIPVDANGDFSIKIPDGYEKGLYRMRLGQNRIVFPVGGDETNINLKGTINELRNYKFQMNGSSAAQSFVDVISNFKTGKVKFENLQSELAKLDPVSNMAAVISIGGKNKAFLPLHEAAYQRMKTEANGSSYTMDYATYVNEIKNPPRPKQVRPQRQRPASKFNVGDVAPDIALSSPDGKNYSLEDLKGKVVLLDFWASWCGPCRRENPAVVKIYEKYKDKGFTVFSVSLDGSTDRWKKAIAQDKLAWPYHVSDLKKWQSAPAKLYGVSSIPKTFMIDRDGKIASIGLRGAHNIEKALLEIL